MAIARSHLVRDDIEGTYHCISRCVRRAFLCGSDSVTQHNYEHRRQWLYRRLVQLSGIFLVDVCGYAIMENHCHVILRNRPDLTDSSSDEDIARRWWRLFPKRRTSWNEPEEPTEMELLTINSSAEKMAQLRLRLSSISWFMRCLKENIAKRANAEDEVTGRFWEGRFKCIALLGHAAILACAAYIDLNPIRAKMASSPETSSYTSAKERIAALQATNGLKILEQASKSSGHRAKFTARLVERTKSAQWLCPLKDEACRRGFLDIELHDYLKLLDWTGRQIVSGKNGAIPADLAPILERLNLDGEQWLESSLRFGSMFYRVAGRVSEMAHTALDLGQTWFKGIQASRTVFLVE